MLEVKFGEDPLNTDLNQCNQLEIPKMTNSQIPKNVLINLPIT